MKRIEIITITIITAIVTAIATVCSTIDETNSLEKELNRWNQECRMTHLRKTWQRKNAQKARAEREPIKWGRDH